MNRFFIVGSPRSGTTILQSIIASHPQIRSFPETHFFNNLWHNNRVLFKLGITTRRVENQLSSIIRDNEPSGWQTSIPHPLIPKTRIYTNYFRSFLDHLAITNGKGIWVEKTPNHLQHIPTINRYLPGSRFIHIVRNGMDVVRSMHEIHSNKHWGSEAPLSKIANRWIFDISLSEKYMENNNHLIIHYNDLINRPHNTLNRTAHFMKIENNFSLQGKPNGIIKESETWKKKVNSGLLTNKNEPTEIFNSDQIKFIWGLINHIDLEKFSVK